MSTAIVLAAKYYEEICFFNDRGERFFYDRDYQLAVNIPRAYLRDLQLIFLDTVNYELFISEEEYNGFVDKIMRVAALLR
jgi:hypothetical protein